MTEVSNKVRVRVVRSFRVAVPGVGLEPVNPGDIVDLPRNIAADVMAANKAELAPADAQLKVQKDYIPEYAKRAPTSPGGGDIADLVAAVREQNALLQQLLATGPQGKKAAAG